MGYVATWQGFYGEWEHVLQMSLFVSSMVVSVCPDLFLQGSVLLYMQLTKMHFSETQNLLVIKTEATFGAALVCYMQLKTTSNLPKNGT